MKTEKTGKGIAVMKKQIAWLLLVAMLAAGFASCGEKTETDTSADTTAAAASDGETETEAETTELEARLAVADERCTAGI